MGLLVGQVEGFLENSWSCSDPNLYLKISEHKKKTNKLNVVQVMFLVCAAIQNEMY